MNAQDLFQTRVIPSLCARCHDPFDALVCFGVATTCCDSCADHAVKEAELEAAAKARADRERTFAAKMPPIMRETAFNHPRFPLDRWHRVNGWSYGPRGLILLGPTRAGKTRCFWSLLQRLHVQDGRESLIFAPGQLEREVASSYGRKGRAEAFYEEVTTAPVLAIDDFGKERFTDRFESFVFSALNERFEWGRPVILTTNFVGNALVDRFDDREKGVPLVERLREFCDSVSFTAPTAARAEGIAS